MYHPVQDPPLLIKEEFDDKKRKKKVKKREALMKEIYFRIFTFPFPMASHTTESKSIKGRTTEYIVQKRRKKIDRWKEIEREGEREGERKRESERKRE